jgi:putative membrane protein
LTIRNYNEHAANERTFLAWVRTSVAITAFGFLIERFDLFLRVALRTPMPIQQPQLGAVAGLVLIGVGVLMVILSALRFIKTAREIDRDELVGGTGSRLDVALAGLLTFLGIALFFYLYRAVSI